MANNLFSTQVKDVVPSNQHLITIDAKSTVSSALHVLSKHNIYSAPVLDKEKGIYYGFLDTLDIVLFLVSVMEKEDKKGRISISFLEDVKRFDRDLAKNVADLSATNPMIPIKPTDTIRDALKVFAETGTHRVPILEVDSVAKIGNVLTQTAVISWLSNHISDLGPVAKKTLKEIGFQAKPVVAVSLDTLAFDAFKKMAENRVTAVAVCNPDGTILSNLSAKDLKDCVKYDDMLQWLGRTAIELVQHVRRKQLNVSFPSFHCHLNCTIEEAIQRLAVLRVHRLYVVDESMRPIGVLSIGDLLKIIMPY